MKSKILHTFTILLLFTFSSKAQIQTGKILLGGSASYNNATNPDAHAFYSNIQLGKVLKHNTVFGVMLHYSSNNYNYTASFRNKTRTIGGGLFYRNYKSLGHNFYFFGEINADYSHGNNDLAYFSAAGQYLTAKSDLVSIYVIPGISYSICKKMQMELSMPNIASISYQQFSTVNKYLPVSVQPQKRNIFSANANLSTTFLSNFAIGFKFFL